MSQKTYKGSCHCGKVTFEADIDLSAGTTKCNCSICRKTRHWGAHVKPAEFRLLTGENELSDYQFGSNSAHHLFCRTCGVRPFGRGYVEEIGGAYVSINIGCLDDLSVSDREGVPVMYLDGLSNTWAQLPEETGRLI